MIMAIRFFRFFILAIIVFLTMIATAASAAAQPTNPGGTDGQADEPDVLLVDFQQTHAEIIAQVRQGILPTDVGTRADELQLALNKYLIETEAQLKILQLDVLEAADGEREAALKKMVALAAERERTKMAYLQRLQALRSAKPAAEKTAEQWQVKELEIEITPEDITRGERP